MRVDTKQYLVMKELLRASNDWGSRSNDNGAVLWQQPAILKVVLIDGPHNPHYLIQLIGFIFAREDGLPQQKLRKNAAHRPHIDFRTIRLGTQQQLRRSAQHAQNSQ